MMQPLSNVGVLASWTGLVVVAWLINKEKETRNKSLCSVCTRITCGLLLVWALGIAIFLWTPSGIQVHLLFNDMAFLGILPIIIPIADVLSHFVRENSTR